MAEIPGVNDTGDYHHGNEPWSKQKRVIPLRTYSGQVVYKRNKHTWHVKDYARVGKYVELDVDDSNPDWLRLILEYYRNATLEVLGKIIPVIPGDKIEEMYDLVYQMLGKFFKVDTSYMTTPPPSVDRIIYYLAEKFRLDITIKPRI